MASKEGMFFKFFEKWKKNRLNSFAKKMLKDNPGIEKHLKKIDQLAQQIGDDIKDTQK